MRRIGLAFAFAVVLTTPLNAQTLRERMIELFTFGDCGAALCLGGISQLIGHGDHFIGSADLTGETALSFTTNAIAINVGNVPIPSTSPGASFEFVDGLPVRTSGSSGPIFAERAETIGRGRILAGINATYTKIKSIRGVPLDNLVFRFGHEDIDPAGLGDPNFENDLIEVQTNLDVNLFVANAFITFGITDAIDIGVAVPFVTVDLAGNSTASILPFGSGASSVHLFDGTAADPVLVSVTSVSGTAAGIGDIAARLKMWVNDAGALNMGLIAEARFPTGDETNLLGSGEFALRGFGIMSARIGDFTPHLNLGYAYRKADFQNNTVLATVGFDQLLVPWATLAVDFLSEWQLGDSELPIASPIVYQTPIARTVESTFIPNRRDDLMTGSVGFKLAPNDLWRIIVNAQVPLGNGGVQSTASYTAGFELHF